MNEAERREERRTNHPYSLPCRRCGKLIGVSYRGLLPYTECDLCVRTKTEAPPPLERLFGERP